MRERERERDITYQSEQERPGYWCYHVVIYISYISTFHTTFANPCSLASDRLVIHEPRRCQYPLQHATGKPNLPFNPSPRKQNAYAMQCLINNNNNSNDGENNDDYFLARLLLLISLP